MHSGDWRVYLVAAHVVFSGVVAGLAEAAELGPSDLSVCGGGETRVTSPAAVSVQEFARRLHGTWELSPRTIQGVTIATDSRFYFDIDTISERQASGTALLIDRGNLAALDPLALCPECLADATLGALWDVRIEAKATGIPSISLSMAGEYKGSYGDFRQGVTATEQAEFYKEGDVYFAGDLTSPAGGADIPDDVWDRIGLTESVLTYVSCRGRFVDR